MTTNAKVKNASVINNLEVNHNTQKFSKFLRYRMTLLLVIGDIFGLLFSAILALFMRIVIDGDFSDPEKYVGLFPYLFIFIIAYSLANLYPGIGISIPQEIEKFTKANSLVMITFAMIIFITKSGDRYSRLFFILLWLLTVLISPFSRIIIRKICSKLKIWGEPVAIIGYGDKGKKILKYLQKNVSFGLMPAIIIKDETQIDSKSQSGNTIPTILSSALISDPKILERSGISTAIITSTINPQNTSFKLMDERQFGIKHLILVADLEWIGGNDVEAYDMSGFLGLEVKRKLLDVKDKIFKRLIDVILVSIMLIFSLPIFFIFAILIRLDSRGPIFYKHKRIGIDGKNIYIWKFRTMVCGADQILNQYLESNPALKKEWLSSYKLKKDPRVTRLGRFLRKTSLDELPQLFNVAKGDMSIVGPRPIVESEVELYKKGIDLYKQVLPGITGLWQISGRSDTSYDYRVNLDKYYIRHWSIWLDIYILFKTILTVLKHDGAY